LFKHFYIEPICSKVSQSLQCLKPHKKILESCARADGIALREVMKVSCKANGTRLVEFIEEGGIDCITNDREEVSECFNHLAATKSNLTTSEEVCGFFRQARDCIFSALNKCDKKKPAELLHSLLEDVVHETPGNCLSLSLQSRSGSSASPKATTTSFLQLITLLPVLLIGALLRGLF